MMHISNNIKKFRELKGLSQQNVADEIGVKRSTYAEWENGIEPKTSILVKISKVIDASIDELLADNGNNVFNAVSGNQTSDIKNPPPGFVKAEDYINQLKEENNFLRRNFETSLKSIQEGQSQAGNQLKALTWFSALAANKGDRKKADQAVLEINNKIAVFEGVGGEASNSSEKGIQHKTGKK